MEERLVLMKNFSSQSKWTLLAASLLLMAVAVCALALGPGDAPAAQVTGTSAVTEAVTEPVTEPQTEPSADVTIAGEATVVVVKTVDELLEAIASDTEITLEPGVYDLTKAKGYGGSNMSDSYHWEEEFDGFALVINGVKNLTITGADKEGCQIVTTPRYAAVLSFESCENVRVSDITAGHTEGPGSCVGAVIRPMNSSRITIENSILYGCGTYGLEAHYSSGVDVVNCDIKQCSLGAVTLIECRNVQISSSRIFDCGLSQGHAYHLFEFNQSRNCAVVDCEITNSSANTLMQTNSCKDIYFISNKVSGNSFAHCVFDVNGAAPIVDACSFQVPGVDPLISTVPDWVYDEVPQLEPGFVLSPDGKELRDAQLKAMTHQSVPFTLPRYEAPAAGASSIDTQGTTQVSVSTVDEFLAAIAPNTTVVLPAGTFDLSSAADYGTGWTDHYRWTQEFDGFELEIMDVENFHIRGAGKGDTILTASPRYADVLMFSGCSSISIQGITAGHAIEPGYCTGGVLNFYGCRDVSIHECGLYGCGIYGVMASASQDFAVTDSEIYDCSYGAVWLEGCENMNFENCYIHHCPQPYFTTQGRCKNITLNGGEIHGR